MLLVTRIENLKKKKESTEILHIPGLISNIEGYQKKKNHESRI